MKISHIAKITNAKVYNLIDKTINTFSIDSRKVEKGDFFVPLKGENFDGHDFIDDALSKGAYGSFSKREIKKENILIVKDPLEALTKVAKFKRSYISNKIAITGTAGKTTTKELLSFVLRKFYEIYFTKGNLNNQIGLPLTLANIDKNYEYGIFELGASKKGDINYLSNILNQDIAIITNVGYGHIAGYKNFNELLEEKLSIIKPAKFVILNENLKKYVDKEKLTFGYRNTSDAQIVETKLLDKGTFGKIKIDNEVFEVFFPFFNLKIIENSAIVFLIFKLLGLDYKNLLKIFKEFKPLNGRGNLITIGNLTIIDETYNANPSSVENAIKTLHMLNGRKILILADMLELGRFSKEKHIQIGNLILNTNIDKVYLYGEEVKYIYQTIKNKKQVKLLEKNQICNELKKEKEKSFVLIKGSRSMKMEEIINCLKGEKSP